MPPHEHGTDEIVAVTVINTFALDLQRTHRLVEQIVRVDGGRTFSTTPEALGSSVPVDSLSHRRLLRPADEQPIGRLRRRRLVPPDQKRRSAAFLRPWAQRTQEKSTLLGPARPNRG